MAPLKKQVCKGCTPQHYTALDRIPPQKDVLHCTRQDEQNSDIAHHRPYPIDTGIQQVQATQGSQSPNITQRSWR